LSFLVAVSYVMSPLYPCFYTSPLVFDRSYPLSEFNPVFSWSCFASLEGRHQFLESSFATPLTPIIDSSSLPYAFFLCIPNPHLPSYLTLLSCLLLLFPCAKVIPNTTKLPFVICSLPYQTITCTFDCPAGRSHLYLFLLDFGVFILI